MANLVRASERNGIDAQISTHLRETLGPLALELDKAQSSFESVRSICELYNKDLKSKLDSLEAEIQKKISELSV